MSFVGEPFDHDVFVSYAHAERETDDTSLREWSQRFASKLRSMLANSLNPYVDDGSRFEMFVDDRSLAAGDELTAKLRQHAERSAILLVLMSPLYPKKSWCLDELGWFLDQAAKDGRGREHCLPVRIQPLADSAWPDQLKDERNAPPVYLDLSDAEAGLPLDDIDAPPTRDVVRKAQVQLKVRLEELRARLQARRAKDQPASFDRQIVYLHAHPDDGEAWNAAVKLLNDAAVVLPDELPTLSNDDALLDRQRKARLKDLHECSALLILRASDSETFRYELMSSYRDLQQVYQETQRRLCWAIVDRVGGSFPLAEQFRVPRLSGDDWPRLVVELLRPTHAQP